jgi:hypothetical protein
MNHHIQVRRLFLQSSKFLASASSQLVRHGDPRSRAHWQGRGEIDAGRDMDLEPRLEHLLSGDLSEGHPGERIQALGEGESAQRVL